ncbi:MAG: hypothetical protein AB7L13_05275 [Acidimicrobiia bacterium]
MDTATTKGLSRRALLGSAGAGAGAFSLGLLSTRAGATTGSAVMRERAGAADVEVATALQAGVKYLLASGHDMLPLDSTQAWTTLDGHFTFTGTSSGYVKIPFDLPVGAVLKEIELYGTRSAGTGTAALEIWTSTVNTGAVAKTESTTLTSNTGPFTLTLALDRAVTETSKPTVFVSLDATSATETQLWGARLGMQPPSAFVASTLSNPRVYDSRTNGAGKLAANEERTVSLGLPAGVTTAVFNLTITETEGFGGYVAVFAANLATWPGNSSINWQAPDQNVANLVVTAISPDGKVKVRGGANKTHVVIDVLGYIM